MNRETIIFATDPAADKGSAAKLMISLAIYAINSALFKLPARVTTAAFKLTATATPHYLSLEA